MLLLGDEQVTPTFCLFTFVPRQPPLETHSILTQSINAPGRTPGQEYTGKYRHIPVHAGSTNFVAPRFLPRKIKELDDIAKAEKTLALDPFTLDARYCNDFVMIHPFLDGNGRVCRLILNAILLNYAGVFVCLGESISLFGEELGSTCRCRTLKQILTGKKK